MTVLITDPPDNDVFPFDEGWAATATIDSNDAMDGVLFDLNTNEIYPSDNTSGTGPVSGIYTWQIPFTPDANIEDGDPLMIYCYDAEISGDGATDIDLASQEGLENAGRARQRKMTAPAAGAPSIDITAASLFGTTVSVTVQLTTQTKGGIFLALVNYTGDIKTSTASVQPYRLSASPNGTQSCTFQGVDASKWTHIFVIAVIYRHRGAPKVKPLKTP